MSAIAEAMGVASGTIFQYVESKEALFNFALRHADLDGPIDPLPDLPIPTPAPGATLQFVRDGVAEARVIASLAAALESDPSDAMTELEAIVGDIYDTMFRNRRGMKLVECCAQDFPDIAMVWFVDAREYLLSSLNNYFQTRIDDGHFQPGPDIAIACRMITETCTYWAVHRHWDPRPVAFDEDRVREMVIQFVLGRCIRPTQ